MTQGEKARAYDKAIERAKAINNGKDVDVKAGTTICEYIFPELAESEDEKIKNRLIKLIKMSNEVGGFALHKWEADEMLTWLEKQGTERKITREEICKSYGIPDIGEFSDGYHTFNGLYKQRMILFAVLVKTYKDRAWKSWKHEDGLDCFGGGWFIVGIDTPEGTYTYHYEAKDWDRFDCQILEKAKHWDGHDESDVERLLSLVSNSNKDNGNVGEVSSNWSEEDEINVYNIIHFLEEPSMLENNEPCKKIVIDWLKSLKDRVQPQPKQEWSEDDKKIINGLIDSLTRISINTRTDSTSPNFSFYKEIDWLKSLRPQNKWKPSKEQIRALKHAFTDGSITFAEMEILATLYEGLKSII